MTDEDGALFDVAELAPPTNRRPGRCEAALHAALAAGVDDGTLLPVDAGLAAAALVAARALDRADLESRPAYAVAALLTPYREALHALRLPAEIPPPARVPVAAPESQTGAPSWADELFGRAE